MLWRHFHIPIEMILPVAKALTMHNFLFFFQLEADFCLICCWYYLSGTTPAKFAALTYPHYLPVQLHNFMPLKFLTALFTICIFSIFSLWNSFLLNHIIPINLKKIRRGHGESGGGFDFDAIFFSFQAARTMVSLQRFLSDPHPSFQRGSRLLHHFAFLNAPPRFWMHPLLRVEDVQAAWAVNVFPLLLFCHRFSLLRVRLDCL